MSRDTFVAKPHLSRTWNESQSAHYESLWTLGQDHRIRVRIKRDSYEAQSSAVAEEWRGRWEPVAMVPYPLMATLAERGAYKPAESAAFERLADPEQHEAAEPDQLLLVPEVRP